MIKKTNILNWRIKRVTEKTFPACRVISYVRPTKLFHFSSKDKFSLGQHSGTIYSFQCNCGDSYVGRTGQRLDSRIKQHIPQWIALGQRQRPRSRQTVTSSITRHILSCNKFLGAPIDHFKVLHFEQSSNLRKILEALEIKNKRPALCVQKERLYDLRIPWL